MPKIKVRVSGNGCYVNGDLDLDKLERKIKTGTDTAQRWLDQEVIRRSDPLVPLRNGILKGSAQTKTVIGSGQIIYQTPYARRWYYTEANFNGAPARGTKWFERMKKTNEKDLAEGVMKIYENS